MDMKKHQNPDGSFNGATFLSELSNLPEEVVRDIWNNVQANGQRLNACQYHELIKNPHPDADRPTMRSCRYICKNCGGTVSETMYRWHELGRRPKP